MNTLPEIGSRVRYTGKAWWAKGHEIIGTVVKHYPAYDDQWDEDTHEWSPGSSRPHSEWGVGVELDTVPPEFPYRGEDDRGRRFVPVVRDVEPVS